MNNKFTKQNIAIFLILFLVFLMKANSVFSQGAAINTTGSVAASSAILDVSSDNAGILIPRMSENDKLQIQSPATGLMIYQTDGISGFWYYDGSSWIQSIGTAGLPGATGPTGATGTFSSGNAVGDIQYWDGSNWVILPAGTDGQILTMMSGVPTWWLTQPPTLTTTSVSLVTAMGATSGGNVTFDGGDPVTTRGICYNISPNPTIANNIIASGAGTGSFSADLTSLTPNTTYYLRAYATNSVGISYGNEISFTTSTVLVGDNVGGGIVFYIDGSGKHGLICATSDQSSSQWGCYGSAITGADGVTIGTGNNNTLDIDAGCVTSGIAAKICINLVLNGYSDWFLPSKDELTLMYQQRNTIGGFVNTYYWASTEASTSDAYGYAFNTGSSYSNQKSETHNVRAIRAF